MRAQSVEEGEFWLEYKSFEAQLGSLKYSQED